MEQENWTKYREIDHYMKILYKTHEVVESIDLFANKPAIVDQKFLLWAPLKKK